MKHRVKYSERGGYITHTNLESQLLDIKQTIKEMSKEQVIPQADWSPAQCMFSPEAW